MRVAVFILMKVFGPSGKLPRALGAVPVDNLFAFDLHPRTRHARDLARALLLMQQAWEREREMLGRIRNWRLFQYPPVIKTTGQLYEMPFPSTKQGWIDQGIRLNPRS